MHPPDGTLSDDQKQPRSLIVDGTRAITTGDYQRANHSSRPPTIYATTISTANHVDCYLRSICLDFVRKAEYLFAPPCSRMCVCVFDHVYISETLMRTIQCSCQLNEATNVTVEASSSHPNTVCSQGNVDLSTVCVFLSYM